MSLADLIKKGALHGVATATPATFATHAPDSLPTVATVATVAVAKAPAEASDDAAPESKPWRVILPNGIAPETVDKFRAASLALDRAFPPGDGDDDPDGYCWPASGAMNTAELSDYAARLQRFIGQGLSSEDAERLADKLVTRDRDLDDRRLCLECVHLQRGWRCGNWQQAEVAHQAKGAHLSADFTMTLQRCAGFAQSAPQVDQQQIATGDSYERPC